MSVFLILDSFFLFLDDFNMYHILKHFRNAPFYIYSLPTWLRREDIFLVIFYVRVQ